MIIKFYHYCQIKDKAPQRFKFTLKKDVDFNYKTIVDIIYLDRKPILHAVDATTVFQVSQFLNNMSAKNTWKTLYQYQINIYLDLSDIMTYNKDTNFDSIEFCAKAKILGITCHQILIEDHQLIRKIEKYYTPIHQSYGII